MIGSPRGTLATDSGVIAVAENGGGQKGAADWGVIGFET